MKKQHLSNKDIKQINAQLEEGFGLERFVDKKSSVERVVTEKFTLILIDGKPAFFYVDEKLVPTLQLLLTTMFLPQVVVDMPAVKFMVNGADVMRPGIVGMGEFNLGDVVVVVDENNKKPLCVCKALYGSVEMQGMEKGKVLKSLHYVGDEIWKFA